MGDLRLLHLRRDLLVGVRAGRLDAESLRRSQHAQRDPRVRLPEQLVPVAERAVHHHLRADVRVAVAAARREAAVGAAEVLARADRRRPRLPRSRAGRRARGRRRPRQSDVAGHGLSRAHLRRAVPEPGRPQLDDEAGTGARRRLDDGGVVPRRIGRQLHGRPDGVVLRGDAARAALLAISILPIVAGIVMLALSSRFKNLMGGVS